MKAPSFLATLVAAAALALVVAYWSWQLFGPAPVRIVAPAPADPARAIIDANLFGRGGAAVAAPSLDAVLPADARLLGTIASQGEQSYALFRLASGPRVVVPGQEIVGGVRLVSIAPESITLRDARGERTFALRNVRTTSPAATPASPRAGNINVASNTTARGDRSCAPPPGFSGNVVRLNTELLGGLSGDAGPWRTLLAAAEGGLVVRDGSGFGPMLGLKAGDRIAQANGIALRVPDDVASAVIRPLVANQGVRIVGSRGGARQELWLANIACAG
jgi:hypothetical protein